MVRKFRVLLLALACSASLAAQAQTRRIDIPAGDLIGALDALAKRSGVQFVYRADQLKGLRTPGVQGAASADDALDRLLRGSGYVARRDASGAVVIVKSDAPARPAPRPAASGGASADVDAVPQQAPTQLETVQVTGSRIPRAQTEGPAPVTVMTAQDIQTSGFTSVPDVLRAMTQNGGETQSQQSFSGGDFSPGAQQVDLRGLGPNHTLVLVNGRRIADFPMPFKGRSNFTDISNIPLGMVDRIEVLTGSASAVYGSDAISGVVNFILKDYADGTTVDLRYGDSQRGGGESLKLSLSSGFSRGDFNAVYGIELLDQKPLWAYERSQQDSTKDSPDPNAASRRVFLQTAWDPDDGDNEYYVDPGQATCDALAYLNKGTTYRASRPNWGRYDPVADDYPPGRFCGSDETIGYGTIISKRRGANAYASLSYAFDENTEWFAEVQLGYHEVELFTDVRSWNYMAPDGNEEGYFFNQATDRVEYWQRQFTPEEMGGLDKGMIRNKQKTFGIVTGFKGVWGQDWDWEASFSHSQYQSEIGWPQIVAAAANNLFLGPQLGVNPDYDLPIFNADPNRLYTPLTRAEYDSIADYTTYHPRSRTDTLSFTLTNTDLFELPAGPAGFAGVIEIGNQSYDLNPDPHALEYYYFSWKDSNGKGNRDRWAVAGELRMPLHETLNLSTAARYDQYRYAGHEIGKFTYSAGLEWRPIDTLLVRGSYGTAFRAADLHYIYAGVGNDETSGVDYYRCRTEEPGETFEDCSWGDEGLIRTRSGNRELDAETSTSWTAGLVWSPNDSFDLSLDYFDIDMRDQVQDMRNDAILRDEADCRIGTRVDGTSVDVNSPTCKDAIARVTRIDGRLYGIYTNPINVARESTSGIDFSTHYRLQTGIGDFRFAGNYTWVRKHDFQQFDGDVVEDEFAVNSGFDIPRTKASATVSWERNAWSASLHGERLGKLPNSDSYDGVFDPEEGGSPYIAATYRYNATLQYRFTDHAKLSLAVDNLFDKMPPRDRSYTAYPYYDVSWFDTLGRTYFVQFTYKFGGKAL
ncbi:TonB-dependent receptor [Luteimonas gilva]|uniref:TonB-dependent receptor n=1 Tax=Luteimonas gilva TaxID=2572684 RepID=A0A4U5JVN3_9GAMM|nr:TonB-dependent receptor [Luteimonas gilva]TKR34010.1 TonB-dependent receptor [Luteimonas gilva]